MSDQRLYLPDPHVADALTERVPFGRHLVNNGVIVQADLVHALDRQRRIDAPLGEILVSEGLARQSDILQALSVYHSAQLVDLDMDPPDVDMAQALPSALCLAHGVVPWMPMGDMLLVATNRPDRFAHLRQCLGARGLKLLPVIADEVQIRSAINLLYGMELAQKAATRVPVAESCRSWDMDPTRRYLWAGITACAVLSALVLAPLWTLTIAMLFAFATLMMTTTLKTAAFWAQLRANRMARATPQVDTVPFRLPKVSVLVPLLKEKEIAGALITRLSRLTYPKSLLDVVLVLEADDHMTRETIARTDLPSWISVIEVPGANRLTTKPRALNYALDFCRGSIIGVWDAEDAPAADQIERIVNRFQGAPENVACLQGILDYYNSRTNWLSRCFTIEYATWWRVVQPGMAKLGLVVPLGGTTLFFRRDILEELCGWDAHNVTEDADLGVRLARHGYVTEMVQTVTYEEANCRAWPWVRQRSRWLKGFMVTWLVHMRDPLQLWRDLGTARFIGLQTIFLATFAQFACAPLLWSFWITFFGIDHPVALTLGSTVALSMAGLFLLAEVMNMIISMTAVSGKEHRHLMAFVPTTLFYFPLGMLAAYKALQELIARPFYWDKTQHGIAPETR